MRAFEWYVAGRYVRPKKGFVSLIAFLSMAGIALGVACLIVVLSVMNGFQKELKARILGVVAHIEITAPGGMEDWRSLGGSLGAFPGISAWAPYVFGQGMLVHGGQVAGVVLRGVEPQAEKAVGTVGTHMQQGTLEDLLPHSFRAILGMDLARRLGVGAGDTLMLVTPEARPTPLGILPRMRRLEVSGIFDMGMYEYDSALVFLNLEDAQKIFSLGDAVTGLRLLTPEIEQAPWVAREIAKAFPGLGVMDWSQQNSNFFQAVQMEKRVMFVILVLVVAVAAFNLVATLYMGVTEKRRDIAILRTMGARSWQILLIFFLQGGMVGVAGTAMGAVLGVVLALRLEVIVPMLERLFGVTFLAKDVYFLSELPSDIQRADVVAICAVSLLLSFLATLYPSLKAAATIPAQALRHA